ncbi:GNAT family N-acetyltransferase [Jongsikchunia kroppenstedtii]|uniref:GNAT family N-acetyltransferase n=1 Tax=Jongsikchunia kroppenstedtii TaxID=1121721 RepID=UPI0003612FD9|nr:GNAT family N-acetyltransferase [Jongsikchunia kroppenstedtii]
MRPVIDPAPLDDPIRNSLTGPHRQFALTSGPISRYRPDVSVFFGHPREMDAAAWAGLADLAGPGGRAGLRGRTDPLPDGWRILETFELVQYSGIDVESGPVEGLVRLGYDDVPEMARLVELTKPGPFLQRTIDLGSYLGVRDDDGSLIAMAGERMRPSTHWREISAVCTAPQARGRGLAARLIRGVVAGIRERGEEPFLHTTTDNPATRLYESLGFTRRSEVPLEIVRIPD